MKALSAAAAVAITALLPHIAFAKDEENNATSRWQAQVQDQPIRAAASVQDEFTTDQITLSLQFSSVHQTFDGLITTLRRRKSDVIRETQQVGMHVAEATITHMELRQRRSNSDDFKYFGNVTVLLTVTGSTDPLDVASRLKRLSARSVGELRYSLSESALEMAEHALRSQALVKIKHEAASEARLRNTELGNMLRFEFETHVNHGSPSAGNVVVISGRGLAVFKPHGQQ
ncbi:hypothetical protein [Anderseniella sp. Alg231-50]|uniref:hypothetical protein n=1 Tax=Anderseniella sp. Alg231-50 TaxID=1922226 RepID=UPI000D54DEBE